VASPVKPPPTHNTKDLYTYYFTSRKCGEGGVVVKCLEHASLFCAHPPCHGFPQSQSFILLLIWQSIAWYHSRAAIQDIFLGSTLRRLIRVLQLTHRRRSASIIFTTSHQLKIIFPRPSKSAQHKMMCNKSNTTRIVAGGYKADDIPSADQPSSTGSSSSNNITSPSQHGDSDRSRSSKRRHQAIFFAAYILFGILHELFHVIVAKIVVAVRSSSSIKIVEDKSLLSSTSIGKFLSRAVFGRYTLITIPSTTINVDGGMSSEMAASIITHSGWILSLLLAFGMHYLYYVRLRSSASATTNKKNTTKPASFICLAAALAPTFILAAYITAVESIASDLMGFVPKMAKNILLLGGGGSSAATSPTSSIQLLLHCGNFGIILLNSQWINVDGGQRALSVLEKMVEVTMMRGAQSGGVVTFEPASGGGGGGGKDANPVIRGVRSRVVNAKRTVLSEGVRKKIEKDNCGLMNGGKLKGWNDVEFNATQGGSGSSGSAAAKRLVRGFFGHTRFATSSKASMDGTHPHQWSPRHTFTCYGFQSKEGAFQGEEELERGNSEHPLESSAHSHGRRHAVGTGMASSISARQNAMRVAPTGQSMGVENFVTHNGECDFIVTGGDVRLPISFSYSY